MERIGKAINTKKLTRLAVVFAILICCCLLTGCDPGTYRFSPEDLSDVTKIELVYYDNADQEDFFSWVPDHSDDLKSFDNSKLTVLETLDGSRAVSFIDALCECRILGTYYAFDSPKGVCIKLTYANGDFLIINCKKNSYAGYIGKFSSDGDVVEFIGCFESSDSFLTLVNDYFITQIR